MRGGPSATQQFGINAVMEVKISHLIGYNALMFQYLGISIHWKNANLDNAEMSLLIAINKMTVVTLRLHLLTVAPLVVSATNHYLDKFPDNRLELYQFLPQFQLPEIRVEPSV